MQLFESNMTDFVSLKKALVVQLSAVLNQRIEEAHSTVHAVREAMQSDTKSSAGDKFETGRAMMQQEMDKVSMQLEANQRMLQELNTLNLETTPAVSRGSLVVTDQAVFFLSVGFGKTVCNGADVFVISPASPFGSQLLGMKAGQELNFGGKKSLLKGVF